MSTFGRVRRFPGGLHEDQESSWWLLEGVGDGVEPVRQSGARARVRGEEQNGDSEPSATRVGLQLAVVLRRPCDATVTWFGQVLGPSATSAPCFTYRHVHTCRAAEVHDTSDLPLDFPETRA
ncbi:hypothetical protein RHMOL_Rhmol02G0207000 [Rhododendron molle]|uniref:Uncharacterized protein n=1 Tax=Rhododendron molle TaxID=49168 RepID=A0ACC0PS39_RHOML|nr:hypothetical protein RHMOL_Rhmol02G0207000 [Rhododendron molle]